MSSYNLQNQRNKKKINQRFANTTSKKLQGGEYNDYVVVFQAAFLNLS